MGIYHRGQQVTLEDILADETFRRFLYTLLRDALFLTGPQVNAFFQRAKPADTSAHWFNRRLRVLLDRLEEGGYIGAESVDLLPPATVGENPVFTWTPGQSLPTEAELIAHAAASARRVPPFEAHGRARLYFGREKLCPFLRRLGYTIPTGTVTPGLGSDVTPRGMYPELDPIEALHVARAFEAEGRATGSPSSTLRLTILVGGEGMLYSYAPWPGREAKFRKVFEWHRAVEARPGRSTHELAGTHLTAHFNLNHLRFLPRFRPAVEGGEWELLSNSRFETGFPDGSLYLDGGDGRGLYFLRAWHAHQLRRQVEEYADDSKHHRTEAWWM